MLPQHRKVQLGWSHGDLGFNVGQVAPTSLETLSRNRRDLSCWFGPFPEDRPNSCSGSPRLTTAYKTNVPPSQIRGRSTAGRRETFWWVWKLDPHQAAG